MYAADIGAYPYFSDKILKTTFHLLIILDVSLTESHFCFNLCLQANNIGLFS